MRKFIASAIALVVLGLTAPIAVATSADAREKVVIIKKDRGHHYGWDKHRHDRDYARGRHHGARVIVR